MNPQKVQIWRRDTGLYGAIAFFGAISANVDFFPKWVIVWSGIASVTLIAIKAKLSNGNPHKDADPGKE